MQFTLSVISGLLLGAILVLVMRRATPAGGTSHAWTAWLMLVVAAIGALILAFSFVSSNFSLAGIFLPVAALVMSVDALIRKDRRWQVWLGFFLGLLPVLFWAYFLLGELLGPPH